LATATAGGIENSVDFVSPLETFDTRYRIPYRYMASMSPDTALTVRTRRDVIVAAHLNMGSQVIDDKTLNRFVPDVHAQYLVSVTVHTIVLTIAGGIY